jgi:hypothetical protein
MKKFKECFLTFINNIKMKKFKECFLTFIYNIKINEKMNLDVNGNLHFNLQYST